MFAITLQTKETSKKYRQITLNTIETLERQNKEVSDRGRRKNKKTTTTCKPNKMGRDRLVFSQFEI